MKQPKDRLEDTLSQLLSQALDDYDTISENENYVINMSDWHTPTWQCKCAVCLAGCVLANTIRLDPDYMVGNMGSLVTDDIISLNDYRKLNALDDLRTGNISHAFTTLFPGKSDHWDELEVPVTPHSENAFRWRLDMNNVLAKLLELGL